MCDQYSPNEILSDQCIHSIRHHKEKNFFISLLVSQFSSFRELLLEHFFVTKSRMQFMGGFWATLSNILSDHPITAWHIGAIK